MTTFPVAVNGEVADASQYNAVTSALGAVLTVGGALNAATLAGTVPSGVGLPAATLSARGAVIQTFVHLDDPTYGALGDDTTDDTTALQAAINAVLSQGGGTVALGPKTYRINGHIIAATNLLTSGGETYAHPLRIVGTGAGTLFNAGLTSPKGSVLDLRYDGTVGGTPLSAYASDTAVLQGLTPTAAVGGTTISIAVGSCVIAGTVKTLGSPASHTISGLANGTYYLDWDGTTFSDATGGSWTASSIRLCSFVISSGTVTYVQDLRSPTAKLDFRSWGPVIFEHLTLANLSGSTTDATPFVKVTASTLLCRDVLFLGPYAATMSTAPLVDALHLGGTGSPDSWTGGGYSISTANAYGQFAGYHTAIERCMFGNVRRAVYMRRACNGVSFERNSILSSCGAGTDAAAIEIDCGPFDSASGDIIKDNIIECSRYTTPILLSNNVHHAVIGHNIFQDEQTASIVGTPAAGDTTVVVSQSNIDSVLTWAGRKIVIEGADPSVAEVRTAVSVTGPSGGHYTITLDSALSSNHPGPLGGTPTVCPTTAQVQISKNAGSFGNTNFYNDILPNYFTTTCPNVVDTTTTHLSLYSLNTQQGAARIYQIALAHFIHGVATASKSGITAPMTDAQMIVISGQPTTPPAGTLVHDQTNKVLWVRNASGWVPLPTGDSFYPASQVTTAYLYGPAGDSLRLLPATGGDIIMNYNRGTGYIRWYGGDGSTTEQGQIDLGGNMDLKTGALVGASALPPFAHMPPEHGYKVWSGDPLVYANSTALTAGRLHLAKVMVPASFSCATVTYDVLGAGSGLSTCFVGLYSSAGSRLWVSSDQSTNMQGAAVRAVSTGGVSLTGGQGAFVWVALLAGAGTMPTVACKSGNGSGLSNVGLTAATCRAGFYTTGTQTALPASFTPGTDLSLDGTHWWAALS